MLFAPAPGPEPLEIPFEIAEKEPLRLLINVAKGPDLGIYEVSLNGVKLGVPMDFYAPEIDPREYHFLDFWPEPGRYLLRLECVGKNHLSSGTNIILESVRLRERRPRVKRWAYDRDNDWRESPLYYAGA